MQKKKPFQLIFIVMLSICAAIAYALINLLQGDTTADTVGIGNSVLTSLVVSVLPAVLLSIWWWNNQDEDEDED